MMTSLLVPLSDDSTLTQSLHMIQSTDPVQCMEQQAQVQVQTSDPNTIIEPTILTSTTAPIDIQTIPSNEAVVLEDFPEEDTSTSINNNTPHKRKHSTESIDIPIETNGSRYPKRERKRTKHINLSWKKSDREKYDEQEFDEEEYDRRFLACPEVKYEEDEEYQEELRREKEQVAAMDLDEEDVVHETSLENEEEDEEEESTSDSDYMVSEIDEDEASSIEAEESDRDRNNNSPNLLDGHDKNSQDDDDSFIASEDEQEDMAKLWGKNLKDVESEPDESEPDDDDDEEDGKRKKKNKKKRNNKGKKSKKLAVSISLAPNSNSELQINLSNEDSQDEEEEEDPNVSAEESSASESESAEE